MKKVLHVTRNLPPLVGGMEKLNFKILEALRSHFDVSVSGPTGSAVFHGLPNYVEFSARPLWLYSISSLLKTVGLAIKFKPHIVFCGSGAAILAGYFSARLSNASLICYLHGLDIIIDNKIYQWLFLPLIKKSDLIFVNSNHTKDLAIGVGIKASRIKIIPPGTMIPDMSQKDLLVREFRSKYEVGNAPFLLIAGRITARKGVAEFIRNVMPSIVAAHPELKLIVVGDEAVDAMKRSFGLKAAILSDVQNLGLEANVMLVGSVDDAMLSAALFGAEVLIFPVLNITNDIEGFGMVAIEAAAHGVPTAGFNVGGIPDAISDGVSGWLIKQNDYAQMIYVISERINNSKFHEITPDSCINFAAQFEWNNFSRKLNEHLQDI